MSGPSSLPGGPTGTDSNEPNDAIDAEISTSAGGAICAPKPTSPPSEGPRYTLYPLSCGGLCDAVTITPATASSARTAYASTGVGSGPGNTSAGRPAPVHTRAVSSANSRERCRASYPMTSGPSAPREPSQRTRPAAAARTTARFIPLGPARSGPRGPAGERHVGMQRDGRVRRRALAPVLAQDVGHHLHERLRRAARGLDVEPQPAPAVLRVGEVVVGLGAAGLRPVGRDVQAEAAIVGYHLDRERWRGRGRSGGRPGHR